MMAGIARAERVGQEASQPARSCRRQTGALLARAARAGARCHDCPNRSASCPSYQEGMAFKMAWLTAAIEHFCGIGTSVWDGHCLRIPFSSNLLKRLGIFAIVLVPTGQCHFAG